MPIQIKDYTWQQDDSMIFIMIPLRGVSPKNIHILTTPKFLKVNFSPYLFETFLFSEIYDEESCAEIGNGFCVFKLKKKIANLSWDFLEDPSTLNNKTVQKNLKEDAFKFYEEREIENIKVKAEVKQELNRFGVKQQIKLEDENRKWIEDKKFLEKKLADEQLEQWKEQQKLFAQQTLESDEAQKKKSHYTWTKGEDIFNDASKNTPLREAATININFTPRVFPTPVRETQTAEEEAWLKKQAEARRIIEIEDSNLSEEEKNPTWLKDKGDKFFKNEDYHSAINAYSQAIRLGSKLPALYSNRATCHLKLNNLLKSIEDSSKALELLTPFVPQNLASRVKAYIRRGTAFCLIELYVEGLQDYQAALKLDPNNKEIQSDVVQIRAKVQGSI